MTSAPLASNAWAEWLRKHDTAWPMLETKVGWDAWVNARKRADFETLARAEMGALSIEELEDYNEARAVWNANLPIVRTGAVRNVYAIVDQVMASSRRDSDRIKGSVVIDAKPGLGKTTIATTYARDYHRMQYRRHGPLTPEGHQFLPVAYISLPATNVTLKALNRKLLGFYGHPGVRVPTTDRLTALLVDVVHACRTKVIVIDDLHFVNFRHERGADVSNHLKWLANVLPVTFVFTGVDLRRRRFFDEGLAGEDAVYAQTSRRTTRAPLEPFEVTTNEGFTQWRTLLNTFSGHLKLADGDPDMLTGLAKEIFARTQGHIASVTSLLERAAHVAIATGVERITFDVLDNSATDVAATRATA